MKQRSLSRRNLKQADLAARGEPFLWTMGGTLVLGIIMIVGFVFLILWNGIVTFYPKSLMKVELDNGSVVAGEIHRGERVKLEKHLLDELGDKSRAYVKSNGGFTHRFLYKTGNYDIYNEDFKWVDDFQVKTISQPTDLYFFERIEWGPFVGTIESADFKGTTLKPGPGFPDRLAAEHKQAVSRRDAIQVIERDDISEISYDHEQYRLKLRSLELEKGLKSQEYQTEKQAFQAKQKEMDLLYGQLQQKAERIKTEDKAYTRPTTFLFFRNWVFTSPVGQNS